MPKLKYNPAWTEDDEVSISEALGLSLVDEQRLFVDHKTIVITDVQASALVALANKDDDAEESEPAASPEPQEGTPAEGDKVDAKEADKPDVVDVHIVTQHERAATEQGEKLSKETNAVLDAGYKARETVNITPLLTYLGMVKDLGKDAVQSMPRPNTYLKGGKTWFGTSNKAQMLEGNDVPYDKYSVLDTSGKKPKKVAMSFYKIEAQATTLGKQWSSELEEVEKALAVLKDNKLKTVPDGKWKGFGKPALSRRATLYASRITFIQQALGKAVRLAHQCYAFDSLECVAYSFEMEEINGKQEYVNRNEPVQIWDVTREKKGNETIVTKSDPINLSIGAFLKFDVAEAIKIAGGKDKVKYEHLAKTVERDSEKAPVSASNKIQSLDIKKAEDVDNVFSALNLFFNSKDSSVNTKHVAAYLQFLTKAENKEALLNAGDGIVALEEIWKQIEKPYYEAVAQRTATQLAEQAKKAELKAA